MISGLILKSVLVFYKNKMDNLIIEDYDFFYDPETKEYKLKSSEREVEGQGDLLQGLN